MIALSKNEILNCLEKVSRQIENICNYRDIPVINFLSNLTKTDIRVYMFISKLRYLSYYEDAFIDMISNDNINLDDLKDRIFIDKKTKNSFSNKQIIKFIRNAFSHSDALKDLYHISANGRYLEIYLKQVKPCEFNIRMTFADLDELVDKITMPYFYLSLFEDNKLKRFYLKNKITDDEFLNIYSFLDRKQIINEKEYSKAVIDYYDSIGNIYEKKEYNIMPEQIKTLDTINNIFISSINKVINDNNIDKKTELIEAFRDYNLSKIIPLEEEKLSLKEDNMLIIKLMYDYPNCSFNQLEKEFINTGYNILLNKPLSEIQNIIYSNIGNDFGRLFLFNGRDLENDTYMEYISYYIMNICNETEIKINNKVYVVEHIRNAFAHGRWFIDNDDNLVLCDTKNGKYNDYNFYWKEKIKLIDLLSVINKKQSINQNTRVLKRK